MSISQLYPEEGPTLNLNFAGSRTLDPRITFTRTQTTSNGSTYMGRDSLIKYAGPDEPRFGHRYVNGEIESLGLLIEEQRQNLIFYSENQNSWSGFRTTVSIDQIFSPDGNVTADLVTASETNVNGGARNTTFTPSIGTFTFSVFAKKNTTSTLLLRPQNNGIFSQASNAYFDLETGETTGVSNDGVVFTNSTQDIKDYGNGWYRCSVTFTLASSDFSGNARIYVVDNSGSLSVTSGASFYIWGAQLEKGAFPTSYIPTEGSTVTRTPDNVSMVGENFSSWYNPSEGTVFLDCTPVYNNSTNQYRRLLSIHNNSGAQTDVIQFIQSEQSNQVQCAVWDGASFQSGFGKVVTSGTRYKVAFAVKENNMNASYDGSISTDDTTCTLPVMTKMDIGNYGTSSGTKTTMHINKISYYPRRLTNSQLITLTR